MGSGKFVFFSNTPFLCFLVDFFEKDQTFLILEFEFGGVDLENSNGTVCTCQQADTKDLFFYRQCRAVILKSGTP